MRLLAILIPVFALVGGLYYWSRDPLADTPTDPHGFIALPLPDGADANTVLILTPPHAAPDLEQRAAALQNAVVLCVSADLPFALSRFCGAEGIENVVTLSSFRSSFGADYGITLADTPLRGLTARAVVVLDENNKVLHAELVPEIGQEPNYEAALAVL